MGAAREAARASAASVGDLATGDSGFRSVGAVGVTPASRALSPVTCARSDASSNSARTTFSSSTAALASSSATALAASSAASAAAASAVSRAASARSRSRVRPPGIRGSVDAGAERRGENGAVLETSGDVIRGEVVG